MRPSVGRASISRKSEIRVKERGERERKRENQAEKARDERSEMRVRTDGGREGVQGRCERRSDREKNTEAALPLRVPGIDPCAISRTCPH